MLLILDIGHGFIIVLCLVEISCINSVDSQGRGAFKDKIELKTSSKYTLRHTESRVKVHKRPREEGKDKSMTHLIPLV